MGSPLLSQYRDRAECTQAEPNIWVGRIIHAFFFFPIPVSGDAFPRATGCTCSVAKTMRWLLHVIARYFRYSRPSSSISRLLRGVNMEKTLVYSGPVWKKRCYPRRMRLAAVSVLISKLLPAFSSDKISSVTSNSDFYTWGAPPPSFLVIKSVGEFALQR